MDRAWGTGKDEQDYHRRRHLERSSRRLPLAGRRDLARVANDAAGHKALLRWIGGEVACVAFEATGAYHAALERALHRAGVPCSKLNPARVRRFAEALGTHAKTDRVDARLLARMGAMVEPQPQTPTPAILAELHELQLARAALIRERTAAKNRAGRLTLALLERQSVTRLRQIERALAELDAAIAALIASDEALARKAEVLCSIPGVSMVTAAAILAEMPELGTLEAATAASLTGPRALHARVRKVAGPGEDRRRAR